MAGAGPRSAGRTVVVAEILGAHGVHGLVRVAVHTERPETVERLEGVRLEPAGRAVTVSLSHPIKGGWAARLEGVETREAAQALAGAQLAVPRESLGETQEADSFFVADLIGATVENAAGERLGTVRGMPDYGAGDLLELVLDEAVKDFGKSLLMPFDRRYVTEIDANGGRIRIDLDRWLAEQV